MQKKALVEVDAQIAKLRNDIAEGRGTEIIQLQLAELLAHRQTCITELSHTHPEDRTAPQPRG